MRKSPQNEAFVATVSYGTLFFYIFFFRVEGCSLIYDGYQHIPLTHSFHMLRLFFYSPRLALTLTSPDPDATGRLSVISPPGPRLFSQNGFSSYIVLCVFCLVFVFMCNFIGVGGSSVIYIFSRLPCACYSYVSMIKKKNLSTILMKLLVYLV